MADMTEEEANALDEELTRTIPKVDFTKPDVFYPATRAAECTESHSGGLHHDPCAGIPSNTSPNHQRPCAGKNRRLNIKNQIDVKMVAVKGNAPLAGNEGKALLTDTPVALGTFREVKFTPGSVINPNKQPVMRPA